MHLSHLRLRDFRNYTRLEVDFAPGFHLLLGGNAQGKTNVLEAIYLMATLRSFRGVGSAQMIRHGQKAYLVAGKVVGEGEHEIRMYWSEPERSLKLDGRTITKATDYLGVLRTTVFCTEDLQLIKGPARGRRRFMDLLLYQSAASYLPLLQRYTRALRARNALLKKPNQDATSLEGFSRELMSAGDEIIQRRRELAPVISRLARESYARVAQSSEELALEYRPCVKNDFAIELAQSRSREQVYRTTLVGPHRDELTLLLEGRPAAQYSSEGQKRTLAIALKMAQAEHLTTLHGAPPILLIDDVMGELDANRRRGVLPLLERARRSRGQVFMTATEANWPVELGADLQKWEVREGRVSVEVESSK